MRPLRIGHSPDPDDAFLFYGFATHRVRVPGCEILHVLEDIQTLNERAAGPDPLEVTALSAHAWLGLRERYDWLEVGSSVGRGYGPRLVAREPRSLDSLAGARIALPGAKTTATLVARGLLPRFQEVQTDFRDVLAAVRAGEVDAGVVIHEGQLTFGAEGFHLVADLGALFSERHGGLPLPLGVNCVRRDLADSLRRDVARAYRCSVELALAERAAALDYALAYGRGISRALADRFIGMYVNEDSLALRDDLHRAVGVLERDYKAHATA